MNPSSKEGDGNGKNGDTFDKVLFRGGGTVSVAVLMWIAQAMTAMQSDVAGLKERVIKVTTELEIVSPRDIKDQVGKLEKVILTKEDVKQIISTHATWQLERDAVLRRLDSLEKQDG